MRQRIINHFRELFPDQLILVLTGSRSENLAVLLIQARKNLQQMFIRLPRTENHLRKPASDIEITAREIQKLKKELYTIIADHSHTPFDKVWADSDRDYWMTAQEAKEYGMVDEVLIKK